jgi:hypothetical protein
MPPEQDETRARQIEALRQYINQLSEQREDPKVEVGMRLPDVTTQRPRRPPLSWLLVTGLLVAVALVGGLFVGASAWSDDRPPAPDAGGGTTATPTTQTRRSVPLVATPDCKTAVDRANNVLAVAVRMRAALEQGAAVASGDPASFDRALAEYREVVDRCALRVP